MFVNSIRISNLFCIVGMLFLFSCQGKRDENIRWNDAFPNTLAELEEGFKNPPTDFSPAPLWVWNDDITDEKIAMQLSEFKEQGIFMVFVHPRPGLITEYLGREWFEKVSYCVEKAKELGMKVWLYDENSYPSGFAGGHVPSANFSDADPVAGLDMKRLDMLSEKDTTQYFLIVKQIGNSFADITTSKEKYYDRPGTYYAFTKWHYPIGAGWYGGFSYVDLLAYGITEKFIKTTMDGYEEYFGDEFARTVPGIFTDEPNINTIGAPRSVMRFTPVLFRRFEEKYGYQLQTYLPCLYDEVGDYKNVRHDYYALLLEMFIERWSKPWNRYTEEKNLKWTGHYWEHGWPDPKHGGDNMAMYAFHQYPGIDMLFNTDKRADQFGNVRAVKELSSVVNQLDKSRALSETYGGSGWELTFNDMKRQGDWEFVLGVNFLNPHLSHMTLKGARKRDYPQSMSYHTPWWNHYKTLNEYFQRLSYALSSGRQINKILIIEPTTTAWMYYTSEKKKAAEEDELTLGLIENRFRELLDKLEKNQAEYDLGSENIIGDHGSVKGDQFVVGSRTYDLVVFPPMTENLNDSVFVLISRYLQNGGKILSFGAFPTRVGGNESRSAKEVFSQYAEQCILADQPDRQIINDYLKSDGFSPADPENWGGTVFHQRRRFKDGQLIFFTNYDRRETARISFSAKGRSVLEFDLFSGEVFPLESADKDGWTELNFELPPSGSKLLFFSDRKSNGELKKLKNKRSLKPINCSETVVERLHANTLTLDYCDLQVEGRTYKNLYFYNAADTVFKTYLKDIYGYNYNPWSNAVQYRKRIVEKDQFDEDSGFEVSFHFWTDRDFIPGDLKAVIESPHLYQVKINGTDIEAVEGKWWLDRDFGVFDISKFVLRNQKNTLMISARPMSIFAEIEPVYLIGDFGIRSDDKFFLTNKPALSLGSWRDLQMPFYGHDVSYAKTFEYDGDGSVQVQLGDWAGTVAEVKVNGESAAIIAWPPYEAEITEQLKSGQNRVEVIVTGSLKNLMGPHHENPEHGFVTPWSFFRAPAHEPLPSEYDLLDYGLFEDFTVTEY